MREIALTNGGFALVDDADFDWLSQYKWSRKVYAPTRIYAIRQEGTWKYGTKRMVRMHRQILGLPCGRYPEVDHRNLNGLDNQRHNIRICTRPQNLANRRIQPNNTSGYKGVFCRKEGVHRWYAKVGEIYGGRMFRTAEEAARRYDEMALQYYGEFAKLNFPL